MSAPPSPSFRVVAFDIDGTLLRGTNSWVAAWERLGGRSAVAADAHARFLAGELSYAEFCAFTVARLREHGCTRGMLVALGREMSLTVNLRAAIGRLRAHGICTAVISGAIDTMLHAALPETDELFDYVFINRLRFDEHELVCGVQATDYDFDGKARALELLARRCGCAMEQTVFVGDGANDSAAAGAAGLSIAYGADIQLTGADVRITRDDLHAVVNAILGERPPARRDAAPVLKPASS